MFGATRAALCLAALAVVQGQEAASWLADRGVTEHGTLPPDPGYPYFDGSSAAKAPKLSGFGANAEPEPRAPRATASWATDTASEWDVGGWGGAPLEHTVYFRSEGATAHEGFEEEGMPVPYANFEPFGGEGMAKDLTRSAIEETDKMVDQIERAQVAETKRATFRALTRLRGAATSAYDGVARSQVGNIAQYAADNKFRDNHEVEHLAQHEGDVQRWAFPNPSAGASEPVSLSAKLTRSGLWSGSDDEFWDRFAVAAQAAPGAGAAEA